MQEAARKVLEENRTLRSLLYQRGVLESEIVVALGGLPNGPYVNNSSVPTLNTILERGTNCGTLLSTAATGRAASSPRHTPSASPGSTVMGTPPPVSYPAAPFTTPNPPPVPVINSDGLCIESHDTKIKTGDNILVRRQITQQDETHHADEEQMQAFYKQPGRNMMH